MERLACMDIPQQFQASSFVRLRILHVHWKWKRVILRGLPNCYEIKSRQAAMPIYGFVFLGNPNWYHEFKLMHSLLCKEKRKGSRELVWYFTGAYIIFFFPFSFPFLLSEYFSDWKRPFKSFLNDKTFISTVRSRDSVPALDMNNTCL